MREPRPIPNPLRDVRHRRVLIGAATVVVAVHAALLGDHLVNERPRPVNQASTGAPASPALAVVLRPAPDKVPESHPPERDPRRSRPTVAAANAPRHALSDAGVAKPAGRARAEEPAVVIETVTTSASQDSINFLPTAADAASMPSDEASHGGLLLAEGSASAPAPVAADSSAALTTDKPTIYRTRLPAPFTLRYAMSRGNLAGTGVLSLTREGDRYEARLQGSVGGLSILGWTSSGVVDTAGFAPVRYVDHRLAKKDQAANFQRDAGKITFSGSSNEYPLTAGSQDRLSWMVQLPSVVAADRSLAKPGARVALFVVGAHGDADVWVFQCQGTEAVDTPSGIVQSSRWMREPRKPYDTKVEVWLDAARHFLPAKARMTNPPSDSPLELLLVEATL